MTEKTKRKRLSDMLMALTQTQDPSERIELGEVVDQLGDQARGALMVVLALPNCLPSPPGTSAITGLPLVFLTLQMALNAKPWLPGALRRRSITRAGLLAVLTRADPWLRRVERFVHPRLGILTSDTAERLVGVVGLFLALTIMLPIPLGNMLPALALVAVSLGFIGMDGLWVLGGLVLGGLSGLLVGAAGWAAFLALMQVSLGWLGL